MICPKCGQENSQDVSCTHCGIIFEKYFQYQQRQRDIEQARWEQEDRRKRKLMIFGGVALAGVMATALFFFGAAPAPQATPATANTRSADRQQEYYPWEAGTTPGYWERNGTQLRWVPTPDQPMLAELATHFVRVGNQDAVGLIVSDHCHVIYTGDLARNTKTTNSDKRDGLQRNYDMLEAELESIKADYDRKRIEFVKTCKVCDDQHLRGKLSREITKMERLERDLAEARKKLDAAGEWAEKEKSLSVYTHDKLTTARVIEVSKQYSLSLLLLDLPSCKPLTTGNPDELQPDAPVFALTGYKKDAVYGGSYGGRSLQPDPPGYLLHDIEISRGDIGTPLFDKQGRVLGLTTTPFNGTQRAIPIDTALRELKLYL